MHLAELPTPAAVIDLDVLERNCARMAERARRHRVRLRPHVKTHKCVEIARLQVGGHFGGLTVSTLAEARAFAEAGFDDVTWALPLPLGRIAEALELATTVKLQLLLDSAATLDALEAEARRRGEVARVFLKVDCGYHRAGVDPDGEFGLRLAERMTRSPQVDFRGVLTHAGHSYDMRDSAGAHRVAEQEREVTVGFAERLRTAGLTVPEVSAGSTPTAVAGTNWAGVSELRPGNYALFDLFQVDIGSCALEDVALSVLTSVIGSYPDRGDLILDAGATALSKDPGATHLGQPVRFGRLFELDGAVERGDLALIGLSQEHGKVALDGLASKAPAVGERFRVLPNHACLAAALHDRYFVVRGTAVVGVWHPTRGW